jgi:hypothetical protein
MRRTAGTSRVEGVLVDWVRTRPAPEPRLPASWPSLEEAAAEPARIRRRRAMDTAREAEVILRIAELGPDEEDPPPGTPGGAAHVAHDRAGVPRGQRVLSRRDPAGDQPGPADRGVPPGGRSPGGRTCRPPSPGRAAGRSTGAAPACSPTCWPTPGPSSRGRWRRRCCPRRRSCRRASCAAGRWRCWPNWTRTPSRNATRGRRRPPTLFVEARGDGPATIGADLPADQAAEAFGLINQLADGQGRR